MSDTEQILGEAAEWRRGGREVALATVVSTWGSSPRPVGSKLAVDGDGRMIGSVSGGCVEGAVVEAAQGVIQSGTPRILDFGVSDQQAWDVGLACGGKVRIFVERLLVRLALLERLLALRREGVPAALATDLATGSQALVDAARTEGDLALAPADLASVRAAIADDLTRTLEGESGPLFVEVWNPALRLVVVGAVHIAQALVPVASLAGYRVTVIDPRAAFGSAERFPGVDLSNDWPDEALPRLKPDKRTAVVTLTHDPKVDDPALQAALRSDAFYIGALGSRRTHAKRCERLAEAGFAAEAIARVRGPVGLAIGALTPAEIAISILAEITAVLRHADAGRRVPAE